MNLEIAGRMRVRVVSGIACGVEVGPGFSLREFLPPLAGSNWQIEALRSVAARGPRTREGPAGDSSEPDPELDPADNFRGGTGGLVDLELLGACAALRRACRCGARVSAGTVPEMLATGAEDGWLADEDEELSFLLEHYRTLRRIEQLLALWDGQDHDSLPADPARRRYLALRLGHAGFPALRSWHRQRCHRCRTLLREALMRMARRDFGVSLQDADG